MDQPAFLVTYKRLDVTELEAERIIGNGYRAVDAVAALAGGKKMEPGIIYHFNGMGSSAMIPPPGKKEHLVRHREETLTFIRSDSFFPVPLKERVSSHHEVLSACYCEHTAAPAKWGTNSANTRPSPPPIETEWNLEMVNANGTFARAYSGKGVKIAILDTGIAHHKDLTVEGGISFYAGDADFRNDTHGHGTHCAGIATGQIGGIAKEAHLFSVKVCDMRRATPVAILAGMGWALRNRMNVVSISLAGPADRTYIPAFTNAVQALMSENCLVVASTGESKDGVGFPANTPGVVAVGGCDREGVLLNRTAIGGKGNHLTVVAPGQGIKTTFRAGDKYMQSFSGSSAATPHVAALIALIRQKFPSIPPLQIVSRILASARPTEIEDNQAMHGVAMLIDCDMALSS